MGWVVNAMRWPLHPPGIIQDPLCMRLGGPQGQSEWVQKISPLLGFNLQTVPSIASRYTKYAILLNTLYICISFHDNKNISDYIMLNLE